MRKSRIDPDMLREHENATRILSEGWALFQQKGFRGVSLDELCQRCGVTKPTLYYYFGDKETLFVEVLWYRLRGFHEVIDAPGPLSQRLQRVAQSVLDSFQSEYTNLMHDREHIRDADNLRRVREAFRDELLGPMVALMRAGIDAGELAPADPEFLALAYMGMINHFIARAAEMSTDHAALATRLAHLFLRGATVHE